MTARADVKRDRDLTRIADATERIADALEVLALERRGEAANLLRALARVQDSVIRATPPARRGR